jgi:hypothetical protein
VNELRPNPVEYEATHIALALLKASPTQARKAAIALHERFFAMGDWQHADLWEGCAGNWRPELRHKPKPAPCKTKTSASVTAR